MMDYLSAKREEARSLLNDSDWAALPDVNLENKQEWLDYRAALRIIVLDKTVADFELPQQPEVIWSK